ncbi:MAG: TraB/GumN family protein, partial [Gammaproteobacteria bacterium]
AGAPADNGLPLDMVLLYRAREAGLSVAGLETLEEQAGVLEGLSLADQQELLRDTVCHYDRIRADQEALKRLYLQRDLAGLARYADRYVSDSGSYDRLEKILLTDRNRRMADRMQDYLRRGDAFIAVGAMHLPGRRGLLRLLEQAGYRVEPVY